MVSRRVKPRVSGAQTKYVLVEDRNTAAGVPDVQILNKWRLGFLTRCEAKEIRKNLEREVQLAAGELTVEVSTVGRATAELVSMAVDREKKLLKVLQFLQRDSLDGVVFYFPQHGEDPWSWGDAEVIEPEALFDDDFRLEAEGMPSRRYPVHLGSAGKG